MDRFKSNPSILDIDLIEEYMLSKYGSRVEGTEKINGINCEKQLVTARNTKIHARWFSIELRFPVKLVSYEGEQERYITELKAIEKVDLQRDLFAPPALRVVVDFEALSGMNGRQTG